MALKVGFGKLQSISEETQRTRKEIEGTGYYQVRRGSCVFTRYFRETWGTCVLS